MSNKIAQEMKTKSSNKDKTKLETNLKQSTDSANQLKT